MLLEKYIKDKLILQLQKEFPDSQVEDLPVNIAMFQPTSDVALFVKAMGRTPINYYMDGRGNEPFIMGSITGGNYRQGILLITRLLDNDSVLTFTEKAIKAIINTDMKKGNINSPIIGDISETEYDNQKEVLYRTITVSYQVVEDLNEEWE